MTAYIRQAHWSSAATSHTDENYWQDSLPSTTLAGSTLLIMGTLSNFATHYCQIAQNVPDGSPAPTGDATNGIYTQLINFSTPVGTQNFALSYFFNAAPVTAGTLFTQNYNEGDDGVGMCLVEVAGVSASPLAGYSNNTQSISGAGTGNISTLNNSGSLGTNPIIMVGFSTEDDVGLLPATDTGAGFTNYSNGVTWSDVNGGSAVYNLSYQNFSNPGTTPMLFNSVSGGSEYASFFIALTGQSANISVAWWV